jgi:diadenosine tetraphosphate (Ap4A) HIT family hydrolase
MRIVDKAEALALLEVHTRQLLPSGGCVMCALARSEPGSLVLMQSEHAVAVLDRFGNQPGHLLVIARNHIERATELAWPLYADVQKLAWEANHAVERVLSPKRVFIAALGAAAPLPMTFPHYHLHVIPVYEDDERARPATVFSWTSGVVVYDDSEASKLCAALRAAWPNSDESAGAYHEQLLAQRELS